MSIILDISDSKQMYVCVLSHPVVSNSVIPWTVAHQTPLSMKFSSPGYLPDLGIEATSHVSCIDRQILYHCTTWETQLNRYIIQIYL